MGIYNIWNPATARRIIHSGVAGSKPIEILPRASVENVELTDVIAEDLMQRFENDPENELRLDFAGEAPKPAARRIKIDESKIEVIKGKS